MASRGLLCAAGCFNTQPPEGGWDSIQEVLLSCRRFNTQPPEGGWDLVALFTTRDKFQHTAA